jgi:D-sedoheptulose 7-phosphate isomerase
VLKALRTAKEMGVYTVGFTGRDGGDMPGVCDVALIVPSDVTARIQEMHILIGHTLCDVIEQDAAQGFAG